MIGGLDLNYLTLVAAVVCPVFGLIVFLHDRKNLLNINFFIFTFFIALWCSTVFYFQEFSQSLFLLKSEYSTGGLVLVSAFPWIILITKSKLKAPQVVLLLIIGLVMLVVPYLDGILIKNIQSLGGQSFSFTQGPLFNIYGGALFVIMAVLITRLAIAVYRSKGQDKESLSLVLAGIFVFILASVIVNIVLPALGVNSVVAYDAQSSLIWVALTAYAVTRSGLFNIKVVATQSFIILLLALILFRVTIAKTTFDFVFESIVFVFTAIIGYFLSGSVKEEIDRRQEIEKLAGEKTKVLDELEARNKNLAALQRVSDIVLNQTEMAPMVQSILDELPKELEDCFGALLSIVKDGHLVAYSYTKNHFSDKIQGILGTDLSKFSNPLKAGYNKLNDAILSRKVVDSDDLSDFISPPAPKPVASTLGRLIGAKYMQALPLQVNNEPFGVLLLIFTAPKERLNTKTLEIAESIADELSIALQRTETLQKLKDANEYLTEIDKMKDEFLSMASHELNTPLAAIEGYISMILDEHMGKVDAKGREYLQRAYDSSKRLASLVIDLLNTSRIEQGRLKMKFAESNIVELAESVTKELQIKSDAKKIYLKVEGDAKKVPLTWCDPERIREVIVNLTGNAIKFTDKGGITISVTSDSNFIKIAVKDTGRGISAEGQKKLFQKFSQVNRAQDEHQGTGLGLYISKNFIELHNGKLSVQSEEGKGATFLIELPILKEAPKEVKGAVLENADSGLQVGPVDSKPGTTAPATTPADAKTTAPAVALAGAAKTETTTPKAETAVISKTEVAPAKESTSTTTSASMTGQNPLTLAPAVSSVESAGSSAKPSTGDTTKPVTGADPTPTKLEPAKEPEKPVHHETKVHHTAEKPASHPVKK